MADWHMKKGDLAPSIKGQMIGPDGVTPVDLTGATVVFSMRPKDRSANAIGGECDISEDPVNGWWRYDWQEEDTDELGWFDGEIVSTDSEGRPMTLPNGEPSRPQYIEILISPRVTEGETP